MAKEELEKEAEKNISIINLVIFKDFTIVITIKFNGRFYRTI